MENNYKRLKAGCYLMNISMSVIGNLSPLLFLTFHTLYNISFSLLGLLVLINFLTQLLVDLIFSFFSQKFNISLMVKITPILTIVGLVIYSIWPYIFPNTVYIGLIIGTFIFSAASGFGEVLISPVIASIPSDNPEREMSKLHSIYAWGVVGVVIFSTLFLLIFKNTSWQYLSLIFTMIPLLSAIMYCNVKIPKMDTPEKISGVFKLLKKKELWICVMAIFLGGAAECTMAQWCSSYLEHSFNIPKVWGDIFGVALFAFMLGLGRTIYAKKGKNIEMFLFLGAIGATLCYLIASISTNPIIGLIACAFTGFCVSMLWPGSLIVSSKKIINGGVFVYAMMAAGGDLGASVGPQLIGIITDIIASNDKFLTLANSLNVTLEQLGMKCGMLVGMVFSILAIVVFAVILKQNNNNNGKNG